MTNVLNFRTSFLNFQDECRRAGFTARMLLDQLCDTPEKCEQARLPAARTLERLYEFLDAVTVN